MFSWVIDPSEFKNDHDYSLNSVKNFVWDILKVMQKKHIRKKAFLGGDFWDFLGRYMGLVWESYKEKRLFWLFLGFFLAFLRLFCRSFYEKKILKKSQMQKSSRPADFSGGVEMIKEQGVSV